MSTSLNTREARNIEEPESHDVWNKWQLKYLDHLGHSLREQQRSGSHCDVIIKVEGIPFRCHKAILCAVSPYFAAMFSHDMKEARESEVTFHETKAEVFELLLEIIYTGEDVITDDNIQDILEISTMMQIDLIVERIDEYLSEKLSVENFIDVWYLAKKYNCHRLQNFVWEFMIQNFASLSSSGELSLLPFETLESLLTDDNLVASSEDIVCNAAISWMLADFESRRRYASRLISDLRLPLCSPDYIINKFNQSKQLKQIPEAASACNNALKYRMCMAEKQNSTSLQTTHRLSSRHDDVMVVIGGADTSAYSGSGMRCYSFQQKQWYTLPPLPKTVGPYYAMCTFGDDIYISGGQYHRETFQVFQSAMCSWLTLPNMINGRYQHAMVAVGDFIFVAGGEGTSNAGSIDEYHVNTGLWESSAQLLENVAYANAIVIEQTIIIFGGKNTNDQYSSSIQSYDTFTKQVTRVTSLSLPGVGCQTVMCDNTTYVISLDGKVITVENDKEVQHVGTISNFNAKKFSIVQYRGIFYTLACSKCSYEKDKAKLLVLDKSSMKVIESLSIPPSDGLPWLNGGSRLGCVKISIGKHHLQKTVSSNNDICM